MLADTRVMAPFLDLGRDGVQALDHGRAVDPSST